MLILLSPLVLTETKVYGTNYYAKTYLSEIAGQTFPRLRGPPGTKLYLELTNGADTLRHTRIFDSEGLASILDMFNPDTGIETQYTPSSTDFMEINGTKRI